MKMLEKRSMPKNSTKREYLILGIVLKIVADIFLISEHYSWAVLYHLGPFVFLFLAVIPISGLALIKWSYDSFSNSCIVTTAIFGNVLLCYSMYYGQEPGIWNIWAHLSFVLWIIMGICSIVPIISNKQK
jgi:hypothetical protein